MSRISDIYAHIAAQPVRVGRVTPTAFALSDLPNVIESAHLPCRVLVPTGSRLGSGSYERVGFGPSGVATVDWQVTDMLLWRAVAQGQGLKDIAATLIAYAGAYAEMTRSLHYAQWNVTNLALTAQVIEWPQGGERLFDGVIATLTITEILDGTGVSVARIVPGMWSGVRAGVTYMKEID